MNSTRTGKIARLPKDIRDELNQRLADGQTGPEILAWLNHLSLVQIIIEERFQNRPVSEKNLSEWRQGGYQDWLRQQNTLALASRLVEHSGELAGEAGNECLSDHFTAVLATKFIELAQTMLEENQDPKQRWTCLCEIHQQFSRLRRDDHRAVRTAIHKERWSRQTDAESDAAQKAYDKEDRRQHVVRYRLLRSGILKDETRMYGDDDIGHDVAAMSLEERYNLEFGLLGRQSDLFAPPKDSDEPLYPWRRTGKKADAKTTSEPAPDPQDTRPETPDPAPAPAVTSPDTGCQTPEPPAAAPIALANDRQPTGSTDESQANENPRSVTLPEGASRYRPARQPSGLAPAKSCEFPVNVTKCNPSKNLSPTPVPPNPPVRKS